MIKRARTITQLGPKYQALDSNLILCYITNPKNGQISENDIFNFSLHTSLHSNLHVEPKNTLTVSSLKTVRGVTGSGSSTSQTTL